MERGFSIIREVTGTTKKGENHIQDPNIWFNFCKPKFSAHKSEEQFVFPENTHVVSEDVLERAARAPTAEEIREHPKRMPNGKACGSDGVCSELIKYVVAYSSSSSPSS